MVVPTGLKDSGLPVNSSSTPHPPQTGLAPGGVFTGVLAKEWVKGGAEVEAWSPVSSGPSALALLLCGSSPWIFTHQRPSGGTERYQAMCVRQVSEQFDSSSCVPEIVPCDEAQKLITVITTARSVAAVLIPTLQLMKRAQGAKLLAPDLSVGKCWSWDPTADRLAPESTRVPQ